MAPHGYGKRSAPGQAPSGRADFAGLRPRDAAIAGYVDRLPDGADISIKTLAAQLPHGQMAIGTSLKRLSAAGHLRRVSERLEESAQWVTRTYFTRTPRSDCWWAAFLSGEGTAGPEVTAREAERPPPPPLPRSRGPAGSGAATHGHAARLPAQRGPDRPAVPRGRPVAAERGGADRSAGDAVAAVGPSRPERSRAYRVLAGLGEADPRMTLSAADCAALERLAEEWLRRGSTEQQMRLALTAGLPPSVHSPRAMAERRLTDKVPPEPWREPEPSTRRVRRVVECTVCRAPGRPEALPGGLCPDCRGEPPPPPDLPRVEAARYAADIRALLRAGRERRPGRAGHAQPTR
ncbi:hypothetical protein PJ985_00485 [Streptomyces sp. ACA25]|uniref:hypothetical protein n=1 Tax=Streptomyces sp. ACA25 TaxID=3022596 RepID=UPI00230783A2|nr:hypothetical protein [Streptomyces sp. ACA25]MDB1086059.1 hypothetical protein [Streptomyces sp. ACA25]